MWFCASVAENLSRQRQERAVPSSASPRIVIARVDMIGRIRPQLQASAISVDTILHNWQVRMSTVIGSHLAHIMAVGHRGTGEISKSVIIMENVRRQELSPHPFPGLCATMSVTESKLD